MGIFLCRIRNHLYSGSCCSCRMIPALAVMSSLDWEVQPQLGVGPFFQRCDHGRTVGHEAIRDRTISILETTFDRSLHSGGFQPTCHSASRFIPVSVRPQPSASVYRGAVKDLRLLIFVATIVARCIPRPHPHRS